MTRNQAIAIFGTQENLADALGIKQPSISAWPHDRIPVMRESQIRMLVFDIVNALPRLVLGV